MPLDPLQFIGTRRAAEGALESTVPLMVAGAGWYAAYRTLYGASAGRPATTVELTVVLGACVALTAWAVGRQFYIIGRRKPTSVAFWGTLLALGALAGMGPVVRLGFGNLCTDALAGNLVELVDLVDDSLGHTACQTRAVPGNAYLQGTVILPTWNGHLSVFQWLLMAALGVMGALGLRERRIRRTRVPHQVDELLRLAAAAGSAGAAGTPAPTLAQIQACKNPTLWGEPCAQTYSKDKVFLPGEWCVRCQQGFSPAERSLRFTVVSLFTAELDVLNGLERQDTMSWDCGAPMDEDPRISGQERWVVLGTIDLPDVLTVSQALAFVHEVLGSWAGSKDERVKEAARLAKERASRLCAWVWYGRHVSRLTFARPTRDVVFASGAHAAAGHPARHRPGADAAARHRPAAPRSAHGLQAGLRQQQPPTLAPDQQAGCVGARGPPGPPGQGQGHLGGPHRGRRPAHLAVHRPNSAPRSGRRAHAAAVPSCHFFNASGWGRPARQCRH